jgi:hypothetical protein
MMAQGLIATVPVLCPKLGLAAITNEIFDGFTQIIISLMVVAPKNLGQHNLSSHHPGYG